MKLPNDITAIGKANPNVEFAAHTWRNAQAMWDGTRAHTIIEATTRFFYATGNETDPNRVEVPSNLYLIYQWMINVIQAQNGDEKSNKKLMV